MTKNILPLFFITLFSIGCGKEYQISPDKLPIAYIGKPYSQDLNITGGKVVSSQFKIITDFPSDMDITIEHSEAEDILAYNRLTISGTPKYKGHYTINIYTGFYGTGDKLNKKYDFIVK